VLRQSRVDRNVLLFCLAPHQRDDSENDLVQEDQKMVEAALSRRVDSLSPGRVETGTRNA